MYLKKKKNLCNSSFSLTQDPNPKQANNLTIIQRKSRVNNWKRSHPCYHPSPGAWDTLNSNILRKKKKKANITTGKLNGQAGHEEEGQSEQLNGEYFLHMEGFTRLWLWLGAQLDRNLKYCANFMTYPNFIKPGSMQPMDPGFCFFRHMWRSPSS